MDKTQNLNTDLIRKTKNNEMASTRKTNEHEEYWKEQEKTSQKMDGRQKSSSRQTVDEICERSK